VLTMLEYGGGLTVALLRGILRIKVLFHYHLSNAAAIL
jgi:hypothetical protein